MSDTEAQVKLTATTGELEAGMKTGARAVEDSAKRMRDAFAQAKAQITGHMDATKAAVAGSTGQISSHIVSMGGAFKGALGKIGALVAIFKGGEAFAACISATKEFTGEANKLARTLGIGATEASTLAVALGDIYSDTDTFTGAAAMLGRQIKQNEDKVRALGLETRDANGHLRNMRDLMMDSIKVINGYKEGTDRNLAAMALWGRGATDAAGLLKLNNDVIEAAKQKQEELGLVVGQENVQALKEYKAAMNDAGDVVMAVKKAVGDAVMPVLTKFAEWFSELGPAAVVVFKGSLGGLMATFWALKNGVVVVWETINAMVNTVAIPIEALVKSLYKLATGDLKGAQEELMNWPKAVGDAWGQAMDSMVDSSADTAEKIRQLFDKPTAVVKGKPKGKDFPGGGDDPAKAGREPKEKSSMDRYQQQLEAMKQAAAEEDATREFSKQQELAYWDEILAKADLTSKDTLAILKTTSKLKIEILRDEAKQRAQLDEIAAKSGQEQALAVVDADEQVAQRRLALGEITETQMLAMEEDFEQRREAIRQGYLRARLAAIDPARDPVAYAQVSAEIESLELQHQLRLGQIRTQALVAQSQQNQAMFQSLQDGFASLTQSILEKTFSWRAAIGSVLQSMSSAFSKTAGTILTNWIKTQLGMQTAGKATALELVHQNAMVSATEAFKAVVGIPIVGPVLAPIAAGAAYAGTMAFASASGGYDIPAGVNPMTQLHQREMVLPAHIADPLRESLAGGGGVGRAAAPSLNVHPLPGGFWGASQNEFIRFFKKLQSDKYL